jgi:glycosyltransferase involved in cell wall biosynthesis
MNMPADDFPVVTVVMIFLNGQRFMREAIESVAAQTFGSWELILVDDGSTDGSTRLARDIAAQCPMQIRFLEHPAHENRGTGASRNLGIRSGRGKYIAFLDCDDVWHPEKLARQVDILTRHPEAAMVYNATMCWYGWTGNPEDAAHDRPRPLGVEADQLVHPPEMIPRLLLDEGQTPGTCSVLLRREAVESVGGFEDSFRLLYEDQAFFYKLFLRHAAFVQAGQWDWYRQHAASTCHVAAGRSRLSPRHPAHGRFLAWFAGYLPTTGITDRSIETALARARRPFLHPHRYRVERALALCRQAATGRAGREALAHAIRKHLRMLRQGRAG